MVESSNSSELLASLQARAKNLLDELFAFQTFLQTHIQNNEDRIEVRHFINNVQSEFNSLARVSVAGVGGDSHGAEDDEREAKKLHMLHSTNLPFYEAVWVTAKRCRGVIALGKRMHWIREVGSGACEQEQERRRLKPASKINSSSVQKKSVLIDVVADDGLVWWKVSTVTAKRLLFEIAKEGWEKYADSEESGSDASFAKPDLELVRLARDLYAASLQVRVRHRHPGVCLSLPKVIEGENVEVDAILKELRENGVTVECGAHPESNLLATSVSTPFKPMLPRPAMLMTSTLNMDCTLLLALISDISHAPPSALPDLPLLSDNRWAYHSAIIRQIAVEKSSPLLPTELYPFLVGRKLICTTHAAKRACEIVDTMGTATERLRADIFIGHGDHASLDEENLRQEMRKYSIHPVPEDLRMPITSIDFEPEEPFISQSEHLTFPTKIAKQVIERMDMSLINRSVFLYGWRENIVTITSNQAVAGKFVHTINAILDEEEHAVWDDEEQAILVASSAGQRQTEFEGPRIWICKTARSLIGKHKINEKSLDS